MTPAGTAGLSRVAAEGAAVIAVMTPEVDQLVTALHAAATDEQRAAAWERYDSAVAPPDR